MNLKEAIREKALGLGYEDAGLTGVEPLDLYIQKIESRPPERYTWVQTENFNTLRGASPLGNQGDQDNVPLLVQSLNDSPHEIVRGMCVWSLGLLGGARAREALEGRRSQENDLVRLEIERALKIN